MEFQLVQLEIKIRRMGMMLVAAMRKMRRKIVMSSDDDVGGGDEDEGAIRPPTLQNMRVGI